MSRISFPLLAAVVLITGCKAVHMPGRGARLEREIDDISQRLSTMEAKIEARTEAIGALTDAVNTRLAYRPLQAWAHTFTTGPEDQRTITFQQTSSTGYIERVSRKCRWNFQRAGHYAEIDGPGATRSTLEIKRFVIDPTMNGFLFQAFLEIKMRTQIQGQYEPPCTGSSVGTTVGVSATAEPKATFRLQLDTSAINSLNYTLDLISPERIGLEFRVHLNGFGKIGFTVPVEGLASRLSAGTINLIVSQNGQILLPDGSAMPYQIATRTPRLTTDTLGIQLATEVDVQIGRH